MLSGACCSRLWPQLGGIPTSCLCIPLGACSPDIYISQVEGALYGSGRAVSLGHCRTQGIPCAVSAASMLHAAGTSQVQGHKQKEMEPPAQVTQQQQQAGWAVRQSPAPPSVQEAAPAHEPVQQVSDSQLAAGQGSANTLTGHNGAGPVATAPAEQAAAGISAAAGQAKDAARSAEIRAASERVPNMESPSTIALGAAPGGKPSGPAPSRMNAAAAAAPSAASAKDKAEEPVSAGD